MARRPAKRPADTGGTQRLTVYLSRETHVALLRQALDESEAAGVRVSATQIVEELIELYLGRKRKGGRS